MDELICYAKFFLLLIDAHGYFDRCETLYRAYLSIFQILNRFLLRSNGQKRQYNISYKWRNPRRRNCVRETSSFCDALEAFTPLLRLSPSSKPRMFNWTPVNPSTHHPRLKMSHLFILRPQWASKCPRSRYEPDIFRMKPKCLPLLRDVQLNS